MADERSKQKEKRVAVLKRVDHTPPPLLIREGSIVVETIVDFDRRTTGGGTGHLHRHIFDGRRVMGLKILDDAGDTIYLNGNAEGCSVKIWWKPPFNGPEQILVDAATFTVETDQPLSASSPTGHSRPKRTKFHTHPGAGADELKQVEVVRGGKTLFFADTRVSEVMVWDTND
jgi:hypothetical protein